MGSTLTAEAKVVVARIRKGSCSRGQRRRMGCRSLSTSSMLMSLGSLTLCLADEMRYGEKMLIKEAMMKFEVYKLVGCVAGRMAKSVDSTRTRTKFLAA